MEVSATMGLSHQNNNTISSLMTSRSFEEVWIVVFTTVAFIALIFSWLGFLQCRIIFIYSDCFSDNLRGSFFPGAKLSTDISSSLSQVLLKSTVFGVSALSYCDCSRARAVQSCCGVVCKHQEFDKDVNHWCTRRRPEISHQQGLSVPTVGVDVSFTFCFPPVKMLARCGEDEACI